MNDLELEIKKLIVEALCLSHVKPENIVSDEPLFVEGLGLDSIDALELGLAIKKKFNVAFEIQDQNVSSYFSSVKSLASYISTKGGLSAAEYPATH